MHQNNAQFYLIPKPSYNSDLKNGKGQLNNAGLLCLVSCHTCFYFVSVMQIGVRREGQETAEYPEKTSGRKRKRPAR